MADRRSFSETLQGQNLRFVAAKKDASRQTRVGFLLQEHFSLPAFTQALDVLVTANLIERGLFVTRTFSLDGQAVTSDLGIVICPDAGLTARDLAELDLSSGFLLASPGWPAPPKETKRSSPDIRPQLRWGLLAPSLLRGPAATSMSLKAARPALSTTIPLGLLKGRLVSSTNFVA